MRFPTTWCMRPAKAQTSLRIRAVWSEPLLVAWLCYASKATDRTSFGVSKLKRRLHMLVWVYICQNATLLEITCRATQLCLTPIPQSSMLMKVTNFLVPHISLWHRVRISIRSTMVVQITCQLISNKTNNYTSRYLCSSDSRTRESVRGTTMRSRRPPNDCQGMEQNIVQGSSCSLPGGIQAIHHSCF